MRQFRNCLSLYDDVENRVCFQINQREPNAHPGGMVVVKSGHFREKFFIPFAAFRLAHEIRIFELKVPPSARRPVQPHS